MITLNTSIKEYLSKEELNQNNNLYLDNLSLNKKNKVITDFINNKIACFFSQKIEKKQGYVVQNIGSLYHS